MNANASDAQCGHRSSVWSSSQSKHSRASFRCMRIAYRNAGALGSAALSGEHVAVSSRDIPNGRAAMVRDAMVGKCSRMRLGVVKRSVYPSAIHLEEAARV